MNRRHFLVSAAAVPLVASGIAARAADEPVFRIGALNPITGAGATYGPGMQATIKAAADMVNAAGGAGGRKLEIYTEDSQTSPEAAVLAAKKLADVNHVDAILGTWSSGVTLAVMRSVTQPQNLLQLHVSGADSLSQHDKDLIFRFAPSAKAFGVVFAKIAHKIGLKRPAILQFNNDSAASQVAGFAETWQKLGHPAPPKPIIYEAKRPTYQGELQDALRDNPDFLVLASYLEDSIVLVREWYQSGFDAKLIMPYWAANADLIKALGKDATQGIQIAGSLPAKTQAFDDFDKAYQAATGKAGSTNKYAAECWDMVNALALAMQAGGPKSGPAEIAAHLRDVTNPPGNEVSGFKDGLAALPKGKIRYIGATGPIFLDPKGDNQGGIFSWNEIDNGEVKVRELVSLI
jgi:branched-chain amino acid transport system substrate-binding protein